MQKALCSISLSRFTISTVRRLISQSSTVLCKEKSPVDIVDFDEDRGPPIPTYEIKDEETLERKKARLLYQSRKRGMLENCVLLSTFAHKYLDDMNEHQTRLYDQLINIPSNDWDIFYWASNIKPTPEEYNNEVMEMLKKHVANTDRELRYQPDLKEKKSS